MIDLRSDYLLSHLVHSFIHRLEARVNFRFHEKVITLNASFTFSALLKMLLLIFSPVLTLFTVRAVDHNKRTSLLMDFQVLNVHLR